MGRGKYKLFSEGNIANLTLPNRLIRSATYEGASGAGAVPDEMLKVYEELAAGGVGMIITGLMMVARVDKSVSKSRPAYSAHSIEGIEKLADVVHRSNPGCKIVGQIGQAGFDVAASAYPIKFKSEMKRAVTTEEICAFEEFCIGSIRRLQESGFDGVQLHAAHGYFLCSFLSPFMNRRTDQYCGSVHNRSRIIREIVSKARKEVGDFPILIKINCSDHVNGGTSINSFLKMAKALEEAGIDAIEVSGGTAECLGRTEQELGFKPVFKGAEAHIGITNIEKQSYHLRFAEKLELNIPVILVGGNRNVERLEEIIQQGKVDFISMARPLICEPDLPLRWLTGHGKSEAACIACNTCYYPIFGPNKSKRYSGPICVFKQDKQRYMSAQKWINSWVGDHIIK